MNPCFFLLALALPRSVEVAFKKQTITPGFRG